MQQRRLPSASFLLAALLAAGAAQAQTAAASGTSNLPPKAGEASTQVNGQPNRDPSDPALTGNSMSTGGSASTMGSSSSSMGASSAMQGSMQSPACSTSQGVSPVPPKAGEASTMVNGRPNANPEDPRLNKSRSELRAEKEMKRAEGRQRRETAVMGQRGATAGTPAGTPPVQLGGTPN